jgi:hypothetical protein
MESLTTECLYFRSLRSFLLQLPEFHVDYQLLQKQMVEFPDSFQLPSQDRARLNSMQRSFQTGTFSLFEGNLSEFTNIILPDNEKSEKNHKELVKEIYRNRKTTLEPFIGPIEDVCPEYPVLDGSLDMMALKGLCAYIIEVKTVTADHAIVGQVMKYYVGMCLKLILKFFNEVKIVTICPGYDPASYRGLRQIGATILAIDPKSLKTTLL